MPTKGALNRFAGLLMLPVALLAGCSEMTRGATETEKEICRQWAESLPSRSRQDTPKTQSDIGKSYDAQAAVCASLGLAQY